jgi:hypothetical protein
VVLLLLVAQALNLPPHLPPLAPRKDNRLLSSHSSSCSGLIGGTCRLMNFPATAAASAAAGGDGGGVGLTMCKTVVEDTWNKIFIGGLPCHYTDEQVRGLAGGGLHCHYTDEQVRGLAGGGAALPLHRRTGEVGGAGGGLYPASQHTREAILTERSSLCHKLSKHSFFLLPSLEQRHNITGPNSGHGHP